MSDTLIAKDPSNLFQGVREPRWVSWIALAATLLLHIGIVLILPDEFISISQSDGSEIAASEVYEISLVDPAEARFVEASPDVPKNEPDRSD